MIVQEYIRKFDELSRYAPKIVAIEQADEEKNEEKRRKIGSMDQGNFLANHERQCSNNNKRKGTPVIQDQNKSKCPKNHQNEVIQKPRYNQCGRTHPRGCRANTRTCFKCRGKGHFIEDYQRIVCNKKRLMLEYLHSPKWMQKETPQ